MRKAVFKRLAFLIVGIAVTVVITACGGGGGSGGGGRAEQGPGTSIVYSGVTAQAQITKDNANLLTTSAYIGSSTGTSFSGLGVVQLTTTTQPDSPRLIIISEILQDVVRKPDIGFQGDTGYSGAIYTGSKEDPGPCGGSVQYSLLLDDATGNFTGTITFKNYCDEGVVISGNTSVSGKADTNTADILEMTVSMDTVTASSGGDSFSMAGSVAMTFGSSSASVVFNALLKDNATGKVVKYDGLNMTVTTGTGYSEISIASGRFYHSDFGYVEISTKASIRSYDTDVLPSEGIFECEGSNGTSAKLTFLPASQYSVQADTDGDKTDDYDTGTLNWADL